MISIEFKKYKAKTKLYDRKPCLFVSFGFDNKSKKPRIINQKVEDVFVTSKLFIIEFFRFEFLIEYGFDYETHKTTK